MHDINETMNDFDSNSHQLHPNRENKLIYFKCLPGWSSGLRLLRRSLFQSAEYWRNQQQHQVTERRINIKRTTMQRIYLNWGFKKGVLLPLRDQELSFTADNIAISHSNAYTTSYHRFIICRIKAHINVRNLFN